MTIKEGIKHKGKFWIPGSSRDDLPEFLAKNGFLKGAEIGVDRGAYSEKLCQAGLTLYSIDPWIVFRGNGIDPRKKEHLEYLYEKTKKRLAPYNCTIIRKTSQEAAKDIPKRSLDFVYIDGDHEFGSVAMDLQIWSDKVRKGGVIAGHDYYSTNRGMRGVRYAVDAFCENSDVYDFYVLAGRDESLSYLFFKHW